jgi:cytochrome d ubiquinol oxidase subunit I
VYGVLRTEDAVSPAPGLYLGFYAVVVVYVLLTALTVFVLRRLATTPGTAAPQEAGAEPPDRRPGEVAVR